jgi:hypothetical protein
MSRDKRDSIRIFWIEQDKEKSARIYPTDVPEKKWENGIELYAFGLTQICRYFNVLVPDDLEIPVRWCYDWLPYSDIDPDLSWVEQCNQVYNTEFLSDKLWGDNFWSPSYFLSTTGNVTIDLLKQYVENQRSEQSL